MPGELPLEEAAPHFAMQLLLEQHQQQQMALATAAHAAAAWPGLGMCMPAAAAMDTAVACTKMGPCDAVAGKPIALYNLLCDSGGPRGGMKHSAAAPARPIAADPPFAYSPDRVKLAIGQPVTFTPEMAVTPARFFSTAPLPAGLRLDPRSGVIHGEPSHPQPLTTLVVEAELSCGLVVSAPIQLEIIDFTTGGFVCGHVSEVEPGIFMMIFHCPESKIGREDTGFDIAQIPTPSHSGTDVARNGRAGEASAAPRRDPQTPPRQQQAREAAAGPRTGGDGRRQHRPEVSDSSSAAKPHPQAKQGNLVEEDPDGALLSSQLGTPELPTVGSSGHASGNCKPCAFLFTKGCQNGVTCKFCHLCSRGEKKRRTRASKYHSKIVVSCKA